MTEPQQVVDWDAMYQQKVDGIDGPPGWSIGELQPELSALERQGRFRSEVLDAGCGFAEGSLNLAGDGYTVVGVDLSATAVAAATATADQRGLTTATYVQADITHLVGYDGRFSTIMDSGLFHALPADLRGAYLSSIYRAAAPGATLFILAFAQGGMSTPPGGGPTFFTEDELRDAVAGSWIIDDVKPAFLHAHVPASLPVPDALTRDDKGRVKGPAWLLTGRKGS